MNLIPNKIESKPKEGQFIRTQKGTFIMKFINIGSPIFLNGNNCKTELEDIKENSGDNVRL